MYRSDRTPVALTAANRIATRISQTSYDDKEGKAGYYYASREHME